MPHIFHHLQIKYHLEREITELYISVAILSFAAGMILIFEPIYMLKVFNGSVSATLVYFALIAGTFGLLSPIGVKILAKIGVKHSMLFSMPFLFLYYVILFFLQESTTSILIFLAIFFKVVHFTLYWPAFHIDFARFSNKTRRGTELGARVVIVSLTSVLGPLIGGFILSRFGGVMLFEFFNLGWSMLFGTVLILLLISAVPLFFSAEVHEIYHDSYKRAFKDIFTRKFWRSSLAFAASGAEGAIAKILWPIFLFLLAINFSSLGVITSGALIIGVIFTAYMGRISNRLPRKRLLKFGSILTALSWIFKIFVRDPFSAFLAHSFYRLSIISAFLPFASVWYDKASETESSRERVIVLREITLNTGEALMLFGLAVVFLFTEKIYFAFPVASILALFFNLI